MTATHIETRIDGSFVVCRGRVSYCGLPFAAGARQLLAETNLDSNLLDIVGPAVILSKPDNNF